MQRKVRDAEKKEPELNMFRLFFWGMKSVLFENRGCDVFACRELFVEQV